MSIPSVGSRVVIRASSGSHVAIYRDIGSPEKTFSVPVGEICEVLKVLPYVTGSGRYIYVRFTDSLMGYVHESNVANN